MKEIGGAASPVNEGQRSQAAPIPLADAGTRNPGRPGNVSSGKRARPKWARVGKVRIHPIPDDCPQELADYIATVVRGAVADGLNKHATDLSPSKRGSLVGSIGKRAVNQLCCAEGRKMLAIYLPKL